MPDWMPYRIAYWDSGWSTLERRIAENLLTPKDDVLDIFLINIEALTLDRAVAFAEQFVKMHYTMCVVDESTCIKNHKAKRTKAITRIGWWCEYRRILSGAPLSNGPLDIFAQSEFLQQGLLGFTSFQSFKCYHASTRVITLGTRRYEKIEKYLCLDELKEKISKFSYRKTKVECLDLPEKIFETRYIQHTDEQAQIYEQLKEEAMVEFSQKSMISSTSALTTLMKLHQINCGHVHDDAGSLVSIPNRRISTLMEIIEEIGYDQKVIIWAHFKEDIRQICRTLSEEFGEDSVVHYYGDTTNEQRNEHRLRFNTDPKCKYFVSNVTGSKALTLIQAAYAIYYSYSYSLETWLQSQDRNHRIGQTRNVTYISIVIPKTVDEYVMKSLTSKKNIADEVLDNWRLMF
jgi:SNF2 family DNA or RNA helicase